MGKYTKTEYSILNISSGLIGYFVAMISSFICRIVFVRTLNSEYLGINGLFSNILMMLSLAELGVGTAIGYALYKPLVNNDQKQVAAYMKLYAVTYRLIGIIICLCGLLLIPFLNFLIPEAPKVDENLILIYLLFLFNSVISYFFSYKITLLISDQKSYVSTLVNYSSVVLQNLLQIVMLVMTKSYILYLLIQIAFTISSNYIVSRYVDRNYQYLFVKSSYELPKKEKHSLFVNVRALLITRLSGLLVNNTDDIMITYFKGVSISGVASNYSLFTSITNTLINQVFNGLTASIGHINAEDNNRTKYSMFLTINLLNYCLTGMCTLLLLVLINDLISIFFGEAYVLEDNIKIIILINFYMSSMQTSIGVYKSTLGLFNRGKYILLITAVFNIAGDLYFGNKYGVFGIFLATALSRVFTNTWYEPYVVYKYGFNKRFMPYIKRYLRMALDLLIVFIVSDFLYGKIIAPVIVKVILGIMITTGLMSCMIWMVYRKSPSFSYLKSFVKNFGGNFLQIKKEV